MRSYITVYESIGGWKALQVWFNHEQGGYWEPYQTGLGAYATREEAEDEARSWAVAEELELRI